MKARIGNQTAWFAEVPAAPFDYAIAQGFDAFEWFPDRHDERGWDVPDLPAEQWARVRDAAQENGIRLSVHASLRASVFEPDGAARIASDLGFAGLIGAALVNVHLVEDKGIVAFADALEPLLVLAAEVRLVLSVENTPATTPQAFNDLFEALQARGHGPGRVGMCLDMGHANLCAATRNDYVAYLAQLEAHVPIVHAHLHENWGDRDAHLPLFTGPSRDDDRGIRALLGGLRQRGFDGSMILEQWPSPPGLLVEVRDRLQRILGEPAPIPRVSAGTVRGEVAAGFVQALADADRARPSWRQKLEWVADTLEVLAPSDLDQLACIAVYLRFLGTGAVPCGESGGHHRPNHHALLSKRIQKQLARLATPHNRPVLRRIYPWLPSSGASFSCAEPLTRIRDIAHRNDIPQELKDRIKRTLQNKLHRNAGPEDLRTSEALLRDVMDEAEKYPASFVRELSVFHDELKDFFHARTLGEQLARYAGVVGGVDREVAQSLLGTLHREHTAESALRALALGQRLRKSLDEPSRSLAGEAELEARVLDVRLEEHAFLLLGQIANALSDAGGAFSWGLAMEAVCLGVQALEAAGLHPAECRVVEGELQAWRAGFDPSERRHLLRLKASLDRAQRVVDRYADGVLSLLPQKASAIGVALGAPAPSIRMYAEGEIRGHVAFQVSRIVDTSLQALRDRAGLPRWDCLVPGSATGRLVVARSLDELAPRHDDVAVALVANVDIDRDVPAGYPALLCWSEIPHLSHFAVRARQAGVVLACCGDRRALAPVESLAGTIVEVTAAVDGVRVREASARDLPVRDVVAASRPAAVTSLEIVHPVLRLGEVTPDTCGAKAWGARRLRQALAGNDGWIAAPDGVAVPFGVYRAAIGADADLSRAYRRCVAELQTRGSQQAALDEVRRVVMSLPVPAAVVEAVSRLFQPASRLMVRSSSNLEDLPNASGAGLHDSIADVDPSSCADAIKRVWASLWNPRALESRLRTGLGVDAGEMAILIQPLIVPEYSFVLHTAHPATKQRGQVYAEIAVGMGETLVRGDEPGGPYRVVYDRKSCAVDVLSYASWSAARVPNGAGIMKRVRVRYDEQALTRALGRLEELGAKLGKAGGLVEDAFGAPQDVEGVVAGERVTLVQSRPQEGLT